jgi:hypothetical protein
MTPEKLDELEATAKAATPGPWFQSMATIVGADSLFVAELISDQHQDKRVSQINADGRFITAANPETVQALIVGVRRIRKLAELYRHCRHACPDCFCTKEARAILYGGTP